MRWIALAIGAGALGVAGSARADHTSIHATASGDLAVTDNVFSSPGGADAAAPKESDAYFTVRPGVLFAYDAPRMIHDLTAEVEVFEYLKHSDDPSLSFRGGWRGFFTPGPRSDLLFQANAGTGTVTAIQARAQSDQAVVTVVPPGAVDTTSADLSQNFGYTAGPNTRLGEGLFGNWLATDDNNGNTTDTRTVGTILSYERAFDPSSISVNLGVQYVRLNRVLAGGERTDQQLNPSLNLGWRRDFGRYWSASASAGVAVLNPVGEIPMDAVRGRGYFPQGGASVSYTDEWGRAGINASRTLAPNLYVAQNTINDGVTATLALPIHWLTEKGQTPQFAVLGTLGASRQELIDSASSDIQSKFYVIHADASLTWTPRPNMTYAVRYEFSHQTGDTSAEILIPAFTRNTIYFTFSLRYPDRIAAEVPVRPQHGRVDGADSVPRGAEPVVPDGYAPPAQE